MTDNKERRQEQNIPEETIPNMIEEMFNEIGEFSKHAPNDRIGFRYVPAHHWLGFRSIDEKDQDMFEKKDFYHISEMMDDIRTSMYDDEAGAWLSLDLDVNIEDAKFNLFFNYFDRPEDFDGNHFSIGEIVEDLQRYPRAYDNVPEWT